MDLPVTARGRNLSAGVFLGLGSVAFLDEVVFHQLLHWHHFYDRSSSSMGLVSDGLFHAFSWFATVAGLLLMVGLVRDAKFAKLTFAAGMLTERDSSSCMTAWSSISCWACTRSGMEFRCFPMMWCGTWSPP